MQIDIIPLGHECVLMKQFMDSVWAKFSCIRVYKTLWNWYGYMQVWRIYEPMSELQKKQLLKLSLYHKITIIGKWCNAKRIGKQKVSDTAITVLLRHTKLIKENFEHGTKHLRDSIQILWQNKKQPSWSTGTSHPLYCWSHLPKLSQEEVNVYIPISQLCSFSQYATFPFVNIITCYAQLSRTLITKKRLLYKSGEFIT